jgi:hypothetical protein
VVHQYPKYRESDPTLPRYGTDPIQVAVDSQMLYISLHNFT